MKTGILGGSFNPIHNAHIELCEVVKNALKLDSIILIPTGDNPFKTTENLVSRFDRLEMTKLAVSNLINYSVSDIEVSRAGVSYTIDTIKAVKAQAAKDERFFFIIGSDLIEKLGEWKSVKTLAKMITFVCVTRCGIDNSQIREVAARLAADFGIKLILIEAKVEGISSTMVRGLAGEHSPKLKEYVCSEVYEYILGKGLYD